MKNELKKIAARLTSLGERESHEATDAFADMLLINYIKEKAAERLAEKAKEGRQGWWDPVEISTEDLKIMTEQSVYSDIDKLIFSVMIEIREEMDRGNS